MHDVIIVGAGPAGLYTARLLGKMDALVLEKKVEIGLPVRCSGLYSANIKGFVRVDDFMEHKVKGAILHSPSVDIRVEKSGTAAYVIDRQRLDKHLASQVQAPISLNEAVEKIEIKKDRVGVKTSKHAREAKILIGCDGPSSIVRDSLGGSIHELINGLIATLPERNYSEFVELWFDAERIPGGFFWKIPRGEETEYGAFAAKVNFRQLEDFFGLEYGYKKSAGSIPFGPPKTFYNRAILIGDAAAQVKPWSGGGVVYGLTCAKIAAKVIIKAFEKNDFSESVLREYETEWRKVIGKNIALGMMFRGFLKSADNKALDSFFLKLKQVKDIGNLDMDFPAWNFEL